MHLDFIAHHILRPLGLQGGAAGILLRPDCTTFRCTRRDQLPGTGRGAHDLPVTAYISWNQAANIPGIE